MIAAALLVTLILKVILGYEYDAYVEYGYQKINANRQRIDKWFKTLSLFLIWAAAVYIFLGIGFYVKFTNDNIIVNRFWDLKEEKYSYSDVKSIKTYSNYIDDNGDLIPGYYFVIKIGDSEVRSNVFREEILPYDKEMVEFVFRKSNQQIEHLQVEE